MSHCVEKQSENRRELSLIRAASVTAPSLIGGPDDELLRLKELLHTQQSRLSERCNRVFNFSNTVPSNVTLPPLDFSEREQSSMQPSLRISPTNAVLYLNGARYNPKPFLPTPPASTRSTEADNGEDAEVQRLEEELNNQQCRINRKQREIERSWGKDHTKSKESVPPPSPPVFEAHNDREIVERAMMAFNFAESVVQNQKHSQNQRHIMMDGAVTSYLEPPVFDAASSNSEADHHGSQLGSQGQSGQADLCDRSSLSMTLGRMSMRSSSVLRVTDGAVALMELLSNKRDVVLLAPTEVGLVRKGDVLSGNNILMMDLQEALRARKGPTGIIAGAPYFRMVPKLNIAGVAQPNLSAIRTIVNELRRAFEGYIVWVNLREEPLIYINNAAHIVRERKDPLIPMIIHNVTGRSISRIESKLKEEVLREANENGGNVSVHMEGRDGLMEDQWECADKDQVFSVEEIFHLLRPHVKYFRRPITRNVGPQPHDFDFILDLCLEDPQSVFVFNCQTGRGKTSAMMMIASIVRFYQVCAQDATLDVRLLLGDHRGFQFRTIKKIVSLIPDGKLHERRLAVLLELSDKAYSIADHINAAFNTGASAEEAMLHLQQYAYFLVFSYYCEQRLWSFHTKTPFNVWLGENNELKLLIASILSMEEEYKAERIAAPVADGEEAWTANIVRRRHGNVLSAGRILCSVPMDQEESTTGVFDINALRQLAPDVPIFTCGRLSAEGRQLLVEEVHRYFPNQSRIQWLSLRAEPMIFINDISYTLTDHDTVTYSSAEMGSTMHASLQAMEQVEERLRRDVILEAQENKGEILLHRIVDNNKLTAIRVKVCSVKTPKSTMAEFAEDNGIDYSRVPLPYSGHMLATDMDPLLKFLQERTKEHDVFIINDTEGSTRTTVALNLITIYRASRVRNLRTMTTLDHLIEVLRVGHNDIVLPAAQIANQTHVNPEEIPNKRVELQVASTICQMLTAGSLLKVVDAVVELGGRGQHWNILHVLNYLKDQLVSATSNKPKVTRNAVSMVRTYLFVLLSAIYIDTMGDYSSELPFSDWVEERVEVANIIANLDQRAEHTLKYVESLNLMKADVSRRDGDVLTANFALKADHFPGCQKKGLHPEICGAPNFRKVEKVNVYGVAIPTILGIHNILSLLGASQEPMRTYPGEHNDKEIFRGFAGPRLFDPHFHPEEIPKPLRGHVFWVNLREEPILYVGDRPFVFRNLEAPYVNVELTGIAAHKVEHVETQLRTDVLREAEEHNGSFLVHDEGNPGELVGMWETATPETVKTTREIYSDLAAKGFRVTLVRLPVTDEQSPSVEDFDALVEVLLPQITQHTDRRETLSFLFNCQMGRGRTTTGMVICCLLIGLVIPEYYDELDNMYNPLYKPEDSELSRGEYGCIVQLKRVLTGGRVAKHHVDLVLEACSKMQNLRTAIESFALQVKSPDVTESQRGRAHHHGVHYLRRYFNIITFAAYLDEEYRPMRKCMRSSFASWFSYRPELASLCDSSALK